MEKGRHVTRTPNVQLKKVRSMKFRTVSTVFVLLVGMLAASAWSAQEKRSADVNNGQDFFIISSVDAPKHEIVLKRPTEVTELVRVNDQTVFLDEQGKRLALKDFRAGDTVYATLASNPQGGPRLVRRLRKGIMTLEVLRRSYLTFK